MQTLFTFLKLLLICLCIGVCFLVFGWFALIPIGIGVLWQIAVDDTKRKKAAQQPFR